jgi:hypothetical protein
MSGRHLLKFNWHQIKTNEQPVWETFNMLYEGFTTEEVVAMLDKPTDQVKYLKKKAIGYIKLTNLERIRPIGSVKNGRI